VFGTSALAGELEVELAAGYTPSLGDVFEVLIADLLVDEFESYAGLDLGDGLYLVPEYRPDSFALRAVPEPTTGELVAAGLLALAAARRRVQSSVTRRGGVTLRPPGVLCSRPTRRRVA
jgi:hypothetical protein